MKRWLTGQDKDVDHTVGLVPVKVGKVVNYSQTGYYFGMSTYSVTRSELVKPDPIYYYYVTLYNPILYYTIFTTFPDVVYYPSCRLVTSFILLFPS